MSFRTESLRVYVFGRASGRCEGGVSDGLGVRDCGGTEGDLD